KRATTNTTKNCVPIYCGPRGADADPADSPRTIGIAMLIRCASPPTNRIIPSADWARSVGGENVITGTASSRRPMESGSPVWSDFSFVAASGYLERVLNALSRKPKFPKDVARETTLRITHVSRALREMGGRGLVECLNPE